MEFEEFGTGRCINCGFLGKMAHGLGEDGCFEARYVDRLTGEFDRNSLLDQGTIPWCFVGEVSFLDRVRNGKGVFSTNKIFTFIREDRNCPYWYKWREFLSPKDHYHEFKMQQLEDNRREFELKLTEMQMKAESKVSKVGIWIGIAAIILAIAEILTMNEDALLWKWIFSIFH